MFNINRQVFKLMAYQVNFIQILLFPIPLHLQDFLQPSKAHGTPRDLHPDLTIHSHKPPYVKEKFSGSITCHYSKLRSMK